MARNHKVEVNFTKEEMEKIKKKAILLGLPLSSFVRMVSLEAQVERWEK